MDIGELQTRITFLCVSEKALPSWVICMQIKCTQFYCFLQFLPRLLALEVATAV